MDAGKQAKRAEVEKHQGRRSRGRPQLRWEDCVRRDMRRSGEDERWREGPADGKLWKERTRDGHTPRLSAPRLVVGWSYAAALGATAGCRMVIRRGSAQAGCRMVIRRGSRRHGWLVRDDISTPDDTIAVGSHRPHQPNTLAFMMTLRTMVSALFLLLPILMHTATGNVFAGSSCSHAPSGSTWFLRDDTDVSVYYKCVNSQPVRKTCFNIFCACLGTGCKMKESSKVVCSMKFLCPSLTTSTSKEACQPNPCKNRATCSVDSSNSYQCKCRNGYSGKNCERDACRPSPCKHIGWCRRSFNGGYKCVCRKGYSGKNCEIDACKVAQPCQNGGYCRRLRYGKSNCVCRPGFLGVSCETYACDSSPCKNNGRCRPRRNARRYRCYCSKGFTGVNCDVDNNAGICLPNPCKNNGVCTATAAGHSCKCANGYSGPTCTVDICQPNPCQHSGVCSRTAGGYSCVCQQGYSGKSCQVDACAPNPCYHSGTCTRTNSGFRCTCEQGYSGNTCVIDACHPNPCKNSGKCSRSGDAFSCDCEDGFSGDTCETKVASPASSQAYFQCRYGFASMSNPTSGLKDEEQCNTWCYVREDAIEQTVQRGCWYPGLFNDNPALTTRPVTGCGFFNDQLLATGSDRDPLLCFCKPGEDFCNDGTVNALVSRLREYPLPQSSSSCRAIST
ncbi:hypothetical protein LSAT2_029526 [Lamellibrachia satsuma]|nr:hypothetical protein LSAT2_029526 [Lamellibrachia satsuma]